MQHDSRTSTDGSPSSQLHSVMMHPMDDMKVTGDVDTDFAAPMIPHHQGAIDMAKIVLEHGKNEELIALARFGTADGLLRQRRRVEPAKTQL